MPLVSNGNPQESITITDTSTALFNSTLANKNIGLMIEFDLLILRDKELISADFSSFESDGTQINHITRSGIPQD